MRKKKKKVRPLGVMLLAFLVVLFGVLLFLSFYNLESWMSPPQGPATTQEPVSTEAAPPSSHRGESVAPPPASSSVAPPPDAYEVSAGYDADVRSRYESYASLYPSLDAATVVKYVNMGLDRGFYQEAQPIDDPASLTALVNKYNYLPSDYVPSDLVNLKYVDAGREGKYNHPQLRKEAADAFHTLCEEASKEGLVILGFSGYRSYQYQNNLYQTYCKNDPVEVVDTYSARPGYSEHQTGLAIDVCTDTTAYNRFGQTEEYQWALDNIHRFGFIISYPVTDEVPGTQAHAGEDPTYLHGYKLEEWHFRYVGVELATDLYENDLLLDEYYALQANKA